MALATTTAYMIALTARLNLLTPDEVALSVTLNGAVRIQVGSSTDGWEEVGPLDEPAQFARVTLSALQDAIIELVTHTGWPPADPRDPDAPQHAASLPEPEADLVAGELRAWYGDREHPALALSPITAADVERILNRGAA